MYCKFCVIIINGFLILEYNTSFFCFSIKLSKKKCFRSVDRFFIKHYSKKNIFFSKLENLNSYFLFDAACFFDYFILRFI